MKYGAAADRHVALKESLYWIAGWAIVTSLRAAQWGFSAEYQHLPVNWGLIWGETILDWGTCALLTIPYVILVRRVARMPLRAAHTVAIYVAASIAGLFVKYAMYVPLENFFFHSHYSYWFGIVDDFYSVSWGNLAVLAVIAAVEHSRVASEREILASRLQAQLTNAQLQALRSQLSPHFLFNTLNAIASLVASDPVRAEQMLVRLGEMLRFALDENASQEVQLRVEADFLQRYNDLMRMRFGEHLTIHVDVPPEMLNERVPHFLLQPLVENSVRHGMGSGRHAMTVTVRARAERNNLHLEVVDDGQGLKNEPLREGIGLGHTRRRLEQLYGELASLHVSNRPEGGTAVSVRLPRRAIATQ